MSATGLTNEAQREHVPDTLGDLLYADKTKHPASENDWIGLVRLIGSGDQFALGALYQRSHRLVFTLIMRIVNNRETAEELTLDVFHDVWRRANSYDAAGGTVLGWIMNQAQSRAIDRLRFDGRKKRTLPQTNGPSPAGECDNTFELDERRGRLREGLAMLTPDERRAIETSFFSELTYAETAVLLNQPLGTIKTRIRSGLEKLRKALPAGGAGL